MKKRTIWIIVALIILGTAAYFFYRWKVQDNNKYGTFIVPRLEYSAFVFKEIRSDVMKFDMIMDIDNPTILGFSVDSFSYDLYMEDYLLFSSTYPQSIDFEGGDTSRIRIPVTMYNDSLIFVTDSLKKARIDTATYRIQGNFYADVPFNDNRKFEYDRSFEAPAYRIPRMEIAEWDFEKLEDGKARLDFTFSITNYNLFPYEFKDLVYDLNLEGDHVLKGSRLGEIIIPKESTENVVLPVSIDIGELGSAFWDFLTDGNGIQYDFYSKMELVGEHHAIEDSPMEIYADGTLKPFKGLFNSND